MKLATFVAAFAAVMAGGTAVSGPVFQREWGAATVVPVSLPDYDSPVDLATNADVTFATGDVKLSCDEAAQVNVDADAGAGTEALPTEEGVAQFAQALTAVQMQCRRIVLHYIDTATKVWADWDITVETYGHPSAMHPTLGTLTVGEPIQYRVLSAYTVGPVGSCLGAQFELNTGGGTGEATDRFYNGWWVTPIANTGAGQGGRFVSESVDYVGSTKLGCFDVAFATALDNTTGVLLYPAYAYSKTIINCTDGVCDSNVEQVNGVTLQGTGVLGDEFEP